MATDNVVCQMAAEASWYLLSDLRDPKKAISHYLSSSEIEQKTEDEHNSCIGKIHTNHAVESPFSVLTCQLHALCS